MPNHHHHAPAGGCYSLSPLLPSPGRARRWQSGGTHAVVAAANGQMERKTKIKEKRTSGTGDVFFLPLSAGRRRRRQSDRETRQCTRTSASVCGAGPWLHCPPDRPRARRTWNESPRPSPRVGRPVFAACLVFCCCCCYCCYCRRCCCCFGRRYPYKLRAHDFPWSSDDGPTARVAPAGGWGEGEEDGYFSSLPQRRGVRKKCNRATAVRAPAITRPRKLHVTGGAVWLCSVRIRRAGSPPIIFNLIDAIASAA